ncbi:hypothetical protein BH11MYX4_BH11MYX4_03200 [soil metagenome]
MTRGVFAVGAACVVAVAACNALSGADALSTDPSGSSEPELTAPGASSSGSSGTTGHDHPGASDAGSSSGSSGTSGGAPVDAAVDASGPTFVDDFQRPSGTVGNGWLEKTSGALSLVNGAVRQGSTGIYRNLLVARPSAENVRDVLVQVTISFPALDADPGLFARIQAGSEIKDRLLGYGVYADGANDLFVSRDDGTAFADLGSSIITPALVPGAQYRLSLQVTGDSPVHLVASIAKLDGTVLAAITANDGSGKRFTNAGSVGFGSSVARNGTWDDFRRVTLLP